MVVQSYKGNRLSILYLNRFGRLANLRRAYRRGCRSKAAFVPLREAQAMSSESAVCFFTLCGVGREEMSVCIYRQPKSAVHRIGTYLRRDGCAVAQGAAGRAEVDRKRMRCGSGIVRFSRSGNADVCGASACAAAFARKQNASALFFARRRKGVSLLRRIWNAAARRRFREAGVRGRSLRLCAGKCGIACRCSTRKSPTAKPKRPSRFRPSPLRVSARRIGNAAAESGEAVFAANKKSVCGAQPQTLIVHPFFFASR